MRKRRFEGPARRGLFFELTEGRENDTIGLYMGHATQELDLPTESGSLLASSFEPNSQSGARPAAPPLELDLPQDVARSMQQLVQEQADSAYQANFGEGNPSVPRLDLLRAEASWMHDGTIERNDESPGKPRYDFNGKSLDEAMYAWTHEPGRDTTDVLNFHEARRLVANQVRRAIDQKGEEQGYLDPEAKAARRRAVAVTDDAILGNKQALTDGRDAALRVKWATGTVPFAEKAADMGYPLMAAVAAGVDPDAPPFVRNLVRTGVLVGAGLAAAGCVSPGVPSLEPVLPTGTPTHPLPLPSLTTLATHIGPETALSPTVASGLDIVYNGVFPPGFGGESTAPVTTVFAADVKNALNEVHLAPVTVEGVGAAHILTDPTGQRTCGPAFPDVIANRLSPGNRSLDLHLDGTTNGVTTYKGADGSMAQVFSVIPLSPGTPDVVCLTAIGNDPTRADFSALWTVLLNTKTGLVEGLLPAFDKDQRLSYGAKGNLFVNGAPVVFQQLSSLATEMPVVRTPKPDTATPGVRLTATIPAPATETPAPSATAEIGPTSCKDIPSIQPIADRFLQEKGYTSWGEVIVANGITKDDIKTLYGPEAMAFRRAIIVDQYEFSVNIPDFDGVVRCVVFAVPTSTTDVKLLPVIISGRLRDGTESGAQIRDTANGPLIYAKEVGAWIESHRGRTVEVGITMFFKSPSAVVIRDYPAVGANLSIMRPFFNYALRIGGNPLTLRPDPWEMINRMNENESGLMLYSMSEEPGF